MPRQAYVLGLAGVVPYLATSMSTLGLAYEIKAAQENGIGVFMNADTAEQLLHLLEPIQVGYGAVVRTSPNLSIDCSLLTRSDHLFSGSNPLGLRMGWLRWL